MKNQLRVIGVSLWLLIFLGFSGISVPSVTAADLPSGSYKNSCKNCRMNERGTLSCECKCGSPLCEKIVRGKYRKTELAEARKCKNGVMNADGHLMCAGTYEKSCGLCVMYSERGEDRFCCNNCKLKPKDSKVFYLPGDRKDTQPTACYAGSIPWRKCFDGVSNCDGRLVCGACPEEPSIIRKNVQIGKVELSPAARSKGKNAPGGSYKNSCGNCTFSENGILRCECRCASPLCVKQVNQAAGISIREVGSSDIAKSYNVSELPRADQCRNGVMNTDGFLMCAGTFEKSCGLCVMTKNNNGERLCCNNCKLKPKDTKVIYLPGDRKDTQPTSCIDGPPAAGNWKTCFEGISNCDGRLQCGACPDDKKSVKKSVRIGGVELSPEARRAGHKIPGGSYKKSCGNCEVLGDGTLKCDCKCGSPLCERLFPDKFRTTELPGAQKCKNGIMNADGNLMCQGSFERSCGMCVMYQERGGDRLCCKNCKTKKGKALPTSCVNGPPSAGNWKTCFEGLSNCDGRLHCGSCP